MPKHPEVLVSFRNFKEAEAVIHLPIGVFDLKEPLTGALGCPDLETVEEFARQFENSRCATSYPGDHLKLSVALGEFYSKNNWLRRITESKEWTGVLSEFDFVKVGLAGARLRADWKQDWLRFADCFSQETQLVPVAYADAEYCQAPSVDEVFSLAKRRSESKASLVPYTMLIDTYDKTRGDLFDFIAAQKLAELISASKKCGMRVVVAGSIRLPTLVDVLECGAELVGVRGAVCGEGERANKIDARRVENFLSAVNTFRKINFSYETKVFEKKF